MLGCSHIKIHETFAMFGHFGCFEVHPLENYVYFLLFSALHIAAKNGLDDVVKELVSKGSDIFLEDENGFTPALACAPNVQVAHCLSILLEAMGSKTSKPQEPVKKKREVSHLNFKPSYNSTI